MTHLRIELNTTGIEEVPSATITKLYNIAHNDTLDNTSNLVGRLHTTATYQDYIDYLMELFDGTNDKGPLYIDAIRKYLMFEDPEVLRIILAHNIGDGTGVSSSDLTSVTNIDLWFRYNTTITSLNDLLKFTNVISISDIATNDTNLTSVALGEGLLEIKNNCFYNCSSLLTIDFPSTLTKINDNRQTNDWGAFQNCTSLTTITGGENITVLGPAFTTCSNLLNLGDIDLSNLIHLGGSCFSGCLNLELGSVTLSNSITTMADSTFLNCKKLTNISIPGVTTITPGNSFSRGSFLGCDHLTTVTGSNITYVGQMSFRYCSALSSIDLSNCTYIGVCAFLSCTSLTSIDLSSCTTIENSAFKSCTSLTSIDLSSCTTIETSAFHGCSGLTTVTLPTTPLLTINDNAFRDCTSLTTVNNINNLTKIGEHIFRGCTSLGAGQTLELYLTNLENYPKDALYGTKYTRLILHSPLLTTTYDPRYPIYERMQQLTYLDLSDWRPGKNDFDNTYYTAGSFYDNNSLVTYIAPINTTEESGIINKLGNYSNFRYLILLATTPPVLSSNNYNPWSEYFYNRSGNVHIYVPDSAKAAYLADSDWSLLGGYNGSDTLADRLHGLSELPAGVWTTGLASLYLTPALLATS